MKRAIALLSVLFALVIFLAACGESQEITGNTTASLALTDIDLESLLIRPNDLPSGFSGAQVSKILPNRYLHLPETDAQIFQQFQAQGVTSGGVAVMLYSSPAHLEAAYRLLLADFGEPVSVPGLMVTLDKVEGVGNHAVGWTSSFNAMGIRLDAGELLFVRCHGLVSMFMSTSDMRGVVGYGRRLDERLQQVVCADQTDDDWAGFEYDSSGLSLADPVYALMVLRYVQNIQSSLDDLVKSVTVADENPMLVFDDIWRQNTESAGSRLSTDADLIARLVPSERFDVFNNKLLEAVGLLGNYGEAVSNGTVTGDLTVMTENIQNLWDGKAKFEALMGQMDDVREAASE